MVFRYLSLKITATESNEINKGKIANHENSGTVGVGVGVSRVQVIKASIEA